MGRQIVNTSGQGLAQSDAVKFAGFAIITAVAVLIIFYFLSQGTKGSATSYRAAPAVTAALPAPALRAA